MMQPWKAVLLNFVEAPIRILRRIAKPFASLILRTCYLAGLRMHCTGKIPASTQFDGAVDLIGTGRLFMGEQCRLGRGVIFETQGDGEIVIGNNVRINAGTIVVSHGKVTIGDDALIGEYVSIRDANHGTKSGAGLMRLQDHTISPIMIGNDVWIGRGSCLLKGVVIDSGAVVGANSVVVRSVKAEVIVAGVPAHEIGRRKQP
jgi:acetyltransferase-like isoleucine patch superfamily enzyme